MDFFREVLSVIETYLPTVGLTVLEIVAALMLGMAIIRVVMRLARNLLLRSRLENSIASFLLSILNAVLYVILLAVIMSLLNIPLTTFVVVISAAGLAISLALQNSLSNLANGFVIISTKPFKEGDYVQIGDVEGTVKSIKMMNTKIMTSDNKIITVPNSTIVESNVVNYNARDTRRVDMLFGVSYSSDIEEVKRIILGVIAENPAIMTTPEPFVRLEEQAASSLNFRVKVWTANADYWDVYYDLNERVLEAFRKNGIEVPFNQLDVNIRNGGGAA